MSIRRRLIEATIPPEPTWVGGKPPGPESTWTGGATPPPPEPTLVGGTPSVSEPRTGSWSGMPDLDPQRRVSTAEMLDAHRVLGQIKTEHWQNMPLDQKLDHILGKTVSSEKMAAQALRTADGFDQRLDRVFKDLSGMIQRVAAGKPPQESGPSIFDDETVQY